MVPDPVTRSIAIAASRAAVWSTLERPSHLERFHPFCERNPVKAWDAVAGDRRDRIEYYSGLVLDRTFLEWDREARFLLEIGPPDDRPSHYVHWELADDGDGSSMTISLLPQIEIPVDDAQRSMLSTYLDSVLAGLAHTVVTGTDVARNQFGALPFFSPET